MRSSAVSGAAVLLSLAPSALALGSAIVINNCDIDVYWAAVSQSGDTDIALITEKVTQSFDDLTEDDGVSLKLATEDDFSSSVTQFEYTLFDSKLAYDLSNINGYPFSDYGIEVVPSVTNDTDNPTCVTIDCPAGEETCTAAYNDPDDVRTLVCADTITLTLTLCPSNSTNSSSSSSSSSDDSSSKKRSVHGHNHNRIHSRHFQVSEHLSD